MALLTSTVGALPKPAELARARALHLAGDLDAAGLRRAEDAALGAALALQERLGLDLLVDGQMDRGDMITCFAERLDGVEVGGLVRCWGNHYYRAARVVGAIERSAPLTVERWAAARAATSRPVKAVLTGPYTLMHWSFDEHYASREDCCMAFAEALRVEAEELVRAGATELQLDEPAFGSRPAEAPLAQRALARVTDAVRGRARVWVHVAYGGAAQLGPDLWALPADGFLVELANSRFERAAALARFPADKLLGAGVLDATVAEVEAADEIVGRVRGLLAHVPAERLWLVPDAGLRGLPEPAVEAKLRAMVEAAAAL